MNNFNAIPAELKQCAQWVNWVAVPTENGKLTKRPLNPHTGTLASVTDPSTWGSFELAVSNAARCSGIGFVLTDNDPFAFIDLDQTQDPGEQALQNDIFARFSSYAELSQSGTGCHIICKGVLPRGKRKGKIELYTSERFMVMTGNVVRNAPISEEHDTLNSLWAHLGGEAQIVQYITNEPQTDEDAQIIRSAANAANGEKFECLMAGNWEQYYSSQSEADFALVDIIAFYTQNVAQITRIFRHSGLGKRDKAKRADYVNNMIRRSFDRMLPKINIDALNEQYSETKEAEQVPAHDKAEFQYSDADTPYTLPPGLIGDIARFVYAQAPRPVPEIAIVSAIGLMAGIAGRAFNVSNTGLNQYLLLLAPTGTGKEGIAKGIEKLMGAVKQTVPASDEFLGPAEIASSQALIKYMSSGPNSFVSVVGEFGIALKQMTDPRAPTHLIGLRRTLLDLFNKSGNGNVVRPTIYSDKDKNTCSVFAPAYTLLGESTPERFYEVLDEAMISEGLLPRFSIVEYHGKRPPLNEHHAFVTPTPELVDSVAKLCAHALMLNKANKVVNVQFSPSAERIFKDFDQECDTRINASTSEVTRHLWNRAHVKAMKLAALVAVGCNPYNPTIDDIAARWALHIVTSDVNNMLARFATGEVGQNSGESRQMADLVRAIKAHVTEPFDKLNKAYRVPREMYDDRTISYTYIHKRCHTLASFKTDKMGAANALKRTIQTLVDRGDLIELGRKDASERYNTSSKCYVLLMPKTMGI